MALVGGIRVAAVVFRQLRGVGYPRNRGDAAGDDFGGLSPRLGGHGRAARGYHDSRARKRPGEDGPNGLVDLNPEFFPVDVQFHDDSFGVGVLLVDALSGLRVWDKGQRTTDKGFQLADVSRS